MHKRGPAMTRPRLAPTSAAATDIRDPPDRETGRGGGRDGGVTHRRWHLQRVQWYYDVRLTHAHLVVPSILAITTTRGGGDDHGGARPRLGRLRRGYGVTALVGDPTSLSSVHST